VAHIRNGHGSVVHSTVASNRREFTERATGEKKTEIGNLEFSRFFQKSNTEKFVLPLGNAEPFFNEYLGQQGFNKTDIEKLITVTKYAKLGSLESKVFEFLVEQKGKFEITFVALMVQDNTVYISFISSHFQFSLAPTYTTYLLFFRKRQDKMLSADEKVKIDSFLLHESLKSLYASMPVDLEKVPLEDRNFLMLTS